MRRGRILLARAISASILGIVNALRPHWVSGCSSPSEGVKQIARPLIASGAVFVHARHEVCTLMLASCDEKQHEQKECSPHRLDR
jgi:hypothetical protein